MRQMVRIEAQTPGEFVEKVNEAYADLSRFQIVREQLNSPTRRARSSGRSTRRASTSNKTPLEKRRKAMKNRPSLIELVAFTLTVAGLMLACAWAFNSVCPAYQ